MMTKIMIMTTLLFSVMKHPMSMGMILMMQTMAISISTGLMSSNFWFSYILFMIMIGGMLVLLIYMTSVASNEKFKINFKLMIMMMTICMIMMMLIKTEMIPTFKNMDLLLTNKPSEFKLSMSKFLNFPMNMMLMSLIIYLLMTLIAVVKITNIKYGPMRQKL